MYSTYEQLAALSVLSGLVNNNKDIYSALMEFIKQSVYKRNISNCKIDDLQEYLFIDYGFNGIPQAVIKTLIRKQARDEVILQNEEVSFLPKFRKILEENNYSNDMLMQQNNFSKLYDNMKDYIHSFDENISAQQIMDALKIYLLDERETTELSPLINQYVLKMNKIDPSVQEILNEIKKGFILYEGICWSDDLNEIGRWKYPLTLFYDMDIIFYLAGYSGSVFKSIFQEMHEFIQEINASYAKNKKGKCIYTYYFEDVDVQINRYFDIALDIVNGERILNPSETAMHYIVGKCLTKADVIRMKSDLMTLLQSLGVSMYPNIDFEKKIFISIILKVRKLYKNMPLLKKIMIVIRSKDI